MAISVAFGLMIITVIILVLLPTLLTLSNRVKVFSMGLWEGQMPALEVVEPANENRRTNYPIWIAAVLYALVIGAGVLFGIFKVVSFIS
jgi:multisubunit Na+/H+ antiporter MnhC subunit